jgi:hypothetical protein
MATVSDATDKYEVVYEQAAQEPTLAALATRLVRTTVPRRLYQVFHLALPVAIDLAMRGWWRGAGWSRPVDPGRSRRCRHADGRPADRSAAGSVSALVRQGTDLLTSGF